MIRALRIAGAVSGVARLWSLAMLAPIPAALAYEPWDTPLFGLVDLPRNVFVFMASFALTSLFWLPLQLMGRRLADEDMTEREGYLSVGLGWLALTLFGTLPFLLAGTFGADRGAAFVNSWFESMSGLTATGMTAIADVDAQPASILLWRSVSQWLGGLGILVLMVALLARLTHGGLQLFPSQGGHSSRLQPKLAETARSLGLLYVTVTLVFAAVLIAVLHFHTGLDGKTAVFDGLIHTMSGYSTGGFSNHSDGLAHYDDHIVHLVVGIMMLAGATNLLVLFPLLRHGQAKPFWQSPEVRFLYLTFAAAALLLVGILALDGRGPEELGHAVFTAASVLSGTGYAVADWGAWPEACFIVLIILMLSGGNAGSPTGGVKTFRWVILTKIVRRELRKLLHPRAVIPIRVGARTVQESTASAVTGFLFTYLALWTLGAVVLMLVEPRFDLVEGSAASAAAVGNIAHAYGEIGPFGDAAGLLPGTKMVLSFLMWFGRLEVFTALLLFFPASWKN